MVVSGFGSTDEVFKKVEIIDLSGETSSCPTIDGFPGEADWNMVGTFINEKALVCGGKNLNLNNFLDACFSYSDQVIET